MPNNDKKLCPMSFNLLPSSGFSGIINQDCAEDRCALWVIDRCAIAQIAEMIIDYVHPSVRSGRSKE